MSIESHVNELKPKSGALKRRIKGYDDQECPEDIG